MKREELFAALNDIRDEFIEEANPAAHRERKAPKRSLRPWIGMAAMLVVVIGVVTLVGKSGLWGAKPSMDNAAPAEAPMEYAMDEKAAEPAEGENAGSEAGEGADTTAAMQEAVEEEAAVEEETPAEEAPSAEDSVTPEGAMEPETDASSELDEDGLPQRPEEILWNGVPYTHQDEILTESPAGFADAGMLETDPEAEFYADDPASSGYSVYTSQEDDSVIYLAVPEGFLAYRK